jgi:hypothetical protein
VKLRGRTAHRVASRWAGFGVGESDMRRTASENRASAIAQYLMQAHRASRRLRKVFLPAKEISALLSPPLRRKNGFSRRPNSLKSPGKPSIFR